MSDPTDSELFEQARSGDRRALEALIERHQPQIYRFGMKMCRNREDAEDVLQETLIAMARSLRDFRGSSSISTWLYTIARRFCWKRHRTEAGGSEQAALLERDGAGSKEPVASEKSPDDAVAGREVAGALERAIVSLEPMYREVLLLRDVEGLTAPEVAEVVGISVDAVKSRLHRARLAVRAELEPLLGAPAPAAPMPAAAEGCPDVLTLFSRHLEQEIDQATCREMEQHVAGCTRCSAACDSLRRTLALCSASPRPEVPKAVQESVRAALGEVIGETR